MRATAVLLAIACSSCTVAQARKAHTGGAVALTAGLVGILACVGIAEVAPSISDDALKVGVVFAPISIIGALTYAATDSTVNEADEKIATAEKSRAYTTAYELAREAKHAARRGDCAEVQAIQPRVRELDEVVYRKFLNDDIIRGCLTPAEP